MGSWSEGRDTMNEENGERIEVKRKMDEKKQG